MPTVVSTPTSDDERERPPVGVRQCEAWQLHRAQRQQRIPRPLRQTQPEPATKRPRAWRSQSAADAPAGDLRRRSRGEATSHDGEPRCGRAAGSQRWRTLSGAPAPTAPNKSDTAGRTFWNTSFASGDTSADRFSLVAKYACSSCSLIAVISACAACSADSVLEARQCREPAIAALAERLRRERRLHGRPHDRLIRSPAKARA